MGKQPIRNSAVKKQVLTDTKNSQTKKSEGSYEGLYLYSL